MSVGKRRKLGTFGLGYLTVDLYVDPRSTGGSVHAEALLRSDLAPAAPKPMVMDIGISPNLVWNEVMCTILHEAQEAVMNFLMHKSYGPGSAWKEHAGDRLFVFSHIDFEQIMAYVAPFLTEVVPLIDEAHTKEIKNAS